MISLREKTFIKTLIEWIGKQAEELIKDRERFGINLRFPVWKAGNRFLVIGPYSGTNLALIAVKDLHSKKILNGRKKAGWDLYLDDLLSESQQNRPRKVLRLIRQLQVVEAWIKARSEGMQRALSEIERQQGKWQVTIDSEIALYELRGDK